MNSHGGHFDRFLKKIKKVKKLSKKDILWHGVLLCVLVAMKKDKLDFWRIVQKNLHKKVYHV